MEPGHLEMLKQGVEKWNTWREKHPDLKPDFGRRSSRREPLGERTSEEQIFSTRTSRAARGEPVVR